MGLLIAVIALTKRDDLVRFEGVENRRDGVERHGWPWSAGQNAGMVNTRRSPMRSSQVEGFMQQPLVRDYFESEGWKSSRVKIRTATGFPSFIPGSNRHCFIAFTACSSSSLFTLSTPLALSSGVEHRNGSPLGSR